MICEIFHGTNLLSDIVVSSHDRNVVRAYSDSWVPASQKNTLAINKSVFYSEESLKIPEGTVYLCQLFHNMLSPQVSALKVDLKSTPMYLNVVMTVTHNVIAAYVQSTSKSLAVRHFYDLLSIQKTRIYTRVLRYVYVS